MEFGVWGLELEIHLAVGVVEIGVREELYVVLLHGCVLSVSADGLVSRADGAQLVVDHLLRGWRLMKKRKRFSVQCSVFSVCCQCFMVSCLVFAGQCVMVSRLEQETLLRDFEALHDKKKKLNHFTLSVL